MWKRKFKARKNIIVFTCIILVSFALLTLNNKRSSGAFFIESLFAWIVSPIQSAITGTVEGVSDLFDHYVFLSGLAEKNEELRKQVEFLTRKNQSLKEDLRRFERVQTLLDYQEDLELDSVVATVIGRDATQWVKAIYIDKGSQHGVKENMAVVTDSGVVGHVIQAGPNSSKVLLLIDRRSSIDSLLQRIRVPGIVEGTGQKTCSMKFVPVTVDVKVGDPVLSSGLGGLYPKGLMVGEVRHVVKSKQGLFQEIEIKPNADLARLEEVLVLIS